MCVHAYECSYMYWYVGVSYLTWELIGLLLVLCVGSILRILLFLFSGFD